MFGTPFPTDGTDRGQVGIGTLIVFIAMVLVAAIAAGVLVDTADMLQESAEQTGEESQAQVSDRIQVIDTYGEVDVMGTNHDPNDPSDADASSTDGAYANDDWQYVEDESESVAHGGDPVVWEVGFVMMRASGAGDINLETVTVSWIGPDGPEQMTLDPADNHVTIDDSVAGSDNNLLDSSGDRAKVSLRLGQYVTDNTATDSSGFSDSNLEFLAPGEEVTVRFNTEAGATVTERISVPTLLQDDETIVL